MAVIKVLLCIALSLLAQMAAADAGGGLGIVPGRIEIYFWGVLDDATTPWSGMSEFSKRARATAFSEDELFVESLVSDLGLYGGRAGPWSVRQEGGPQGVRAVLRIHDRFDAKNCVLILVTDASLIRADNNMSVKRNEPMKIVLKHLAMPQSDH